MRGYKLVNDYNATGEICKYTSYDSRTIIDIRSIFRRVQWRKGVHLVCKEESIIQKNHRKKYYPEVLR